MNQALARELIGIAFFTVGALAILLLWIARRRTRVANGHASEGHGDRGLNNDSSSRPPVIVDAAPDEPVAFGYKISWLAIRSTDTNQVARVLGLTDLQPANWETGLEAAIRGERIFVSPAIEGWVFVAGLQLPEPGTPEQMAVWEPWLRRIAGEFSHVQFFGNHRALGFHAWARFVDGCETRAFSYVGDQGEIYVDRGTPASVEQAWQQNGEDDDCVPDEEDVLRVAAEWGFNPMTLEDRDYPRGVGLIGRLSP